MQITFKALAGQANFVCPGGAAPSAVTVNGSSVVFVGRPGGFTIDAEDLPTAGQLVVATFDDPEGYVSLDTVNDAIAALADDVGDVQTDVTALQADVTAMQADIDTIVTNTTP